MASVETRVSDFSLKAYQGDFKTLLAFNFASQEAAAGLAGFTIRYTIPDGTSFYLWNSLVYEHPENHAQIANEPPQSTANAPIHKFRWVHVPGAIHQGEAPVSGNYLYEVTPRFFDGAQRMLPLDNAHTARVDVPVGPFRKGGLSLGFTRGFVQSEAFVHRYGKDALIRPKGKDLIFDTSAQAGLAPTGGAPFTFAQEYAWLGFTARDLVFDLIAVVGQDDALTLDVFAYDLTEPDFIQALVAMAARPGKLRVILDDAALHHAADGSKPEDQAEALIARAAGAAQVIKRGHFARYAHDKVLVVSDAAGPLKVLTGSTNFSVNGLYVNSNHVLVYDDREVAGWYKGVFDSAWNDDVKAAPFIASDWSTESFATASPALPKSTIHFSPHTPETAQSILDGLVARVNQEKTAPAGQGSVLFAVMALNEAKDVVYRDLSDPATAQAVRANAATGAIQNFAEKDALRSLGTTYFGAGQSGERAFAAFTQGMVQWKAFGDNRAYEMMQAGAQRYFERGGYGAQDAALKASTVIAHASVDPTFGKLSANAFDQEQMLRNDITAAQVQAGGMEGRRDFAGDGVAPNERSNSAQELEWRTGRNIGQSHAAAMLGLSLKETSSRMGFINTLAGEARASAITQLSRATGRNEAQVEKALETYNAASQVGTADGTGNEAAREHTSIYGRSREAARYDFAERSGKLDAQREVGTGGTRSAARIGEERRQADNAGFAQGAAAAGVPVREAARLDSFIQALSKTVGNQTDLAEGGAGGVADRAHNERLTRVVDNERLTRMQSLLHGQGIELSRRQIAMDQNGDLNLNLTPATAAAMWKGGLINESQLGAIANGGHARFSFAHNDLLVSSSTGFSQSARSDTSTRFEAGKQAGPDTIEHFLGDGPKGQAMMENWLRGGFEMDRKGNWRLKPQVADTLQRDVQAVMAQTGWTRSLSRSAEHSASIGTSVSGSLDASVNRAMGSSARGKRGGDRGRGQLSGGIGGRLGIESTDRGTTAETGHSSIDILNYDIRGAMAAAENRASKSSQPSHAFVEELQKQILGPEGMRNRYLEQADSARGTFDPSAPITSFEQASLLEKGRYTFDPPSGTGDGDASFKDRKDR